MSWRTCSRRFQGASTVHTGDGVPDSVEAKAVASCPGMAWIHVGAVRTMMQRADSAPLSIPRSRAAPRRGQPRRAAIRFSVGLAAADGSGFTILESLIAVALLSVVIVSTVGLMLIATTRGSANRRAMEAATLAQRELETVRALRFSDIVSSARSVSLGGADVFSVARTVTPLARPAHLKRVQVHVRWGSDGEYDVETVFGDLAP